MNANEAPEKIYINSNIENRTWLIGRGDISFIEYTRTDAFIEKAVSYLEGTLFDEVCYGEIRHDIVQAYIDDFKKAMKL